MCEIDSHAIKLTIPFDNEWKEITSDSKTYFTICCTERGTKKKLNSNFTRIINRKLQEEYNLNCYLINGNGDNWFSSEGCIRQNSNDWKGIYFCKEKSCRNRFSLFIKDIKNPFINAFFDNIGKHKRIKVRDSCRGSAREHLKLKIMADGISNTYNKNIVSKSEKFYYYNTYF